MINTALTRAAAADIAPAEALSHRLNSTEGTQQHAN